MAGPMILLILALVFGFYMAWSIGANDVANAMGTSVGSGALTLRRAVILAAIMEFFGAFLVGPHVSEAVRKNIVDPTDIRYVQVQKALNLPSKPNAAEMKALETQAENNPALAKDLRKASEDAALVLAWGMTAALLASAVWLNIASYYGWPVSTTHSIVGSIVGFGLVYGGMATIKWGKLGGILASWVVSPTLAGVIAFIIFRLILTGIFYKPDPVAAAKKATPYIAGFVMLTMMLVLTFKGLKPFWEYPFWEKQFGLKFTSHLDTIPLTIGLTTAVIVGLVGWFVSAKLVSRIASDTIESEQARHLYITRSLSKAIMHLRRVQNTSNSKVQQNTTVVLGQTEAIYEQLRKKIDTDQTQSAYGQVERIFIYLQVISAAFVAFAHGANDVANAIGPISLVVETVWTLEVPEKTTIPLWMLGLGGVGIVIGLATWGWRVIETVGKRITELTPSRGFCAEFAAALTILLASVYKLPISTTHTLVGAVLGVGLARGIQAINLNTVRDIAIAWVITVPAGAGLTVLFFTVLRALFG